MLAPEPTQHAQHERQVGLVRSQAEGAQPARGGAADQQGGAGAWGGGKIAGSSKVIKHALSRGLQLSEGKHNSQAQGCGCPGMERSHCLHSRALLTGAEHVHLQLRDPLGLHLVPGAAVGNNVGSRRLAPPAPAAGVW